MMRDDDFKLLRGFADGRTNERTNERTDICDCRVAFATENQKTLKGTKSRISFVTENVQIVTTHVKCDMCM